MSTHSTAPFRANAHLLKLLGDQLIGDDRLAIFELVKNAYDADATSVDVELNLEAEEPYLMVLDHEGHGMNKETIKNKWLEIGTDSKRNKNWVKSSRFGRLPLGEKGVGRLAVHKLGSIMQMNTKQDGFPEVEVIIDWPKLINDATYLEDTKITIRELESPVFFKKNTTGTRITISHLNKKEWTRGDIRKLKRLLTSITSPFQGVSDFDVKLSVPGREKDYEDILEAADILNNALWKYKFKIDKSGMFTYEYEFTPPALYKSLTRTDEIQAPERLELYPPSKEEKRARSKENNEKLLLTSDDLKGIGPLEGCFYVFTRDREILNALGAYQSIIEYLNEQTGIRVYRDGIRVFNYGEPNEDWLGLNAMRVNNPGKRIGVNLVVGNVEINLADSRGLQEKTNREGFDENDTFIRFRLIVYSLIEHFQILHRSDREALDQAKKNSKQIASQPRFRFEENIKELKDSLVKHKLDKILGGKLKQIEEDYKQMRDVTLSSVTGINLSVIFHEVERGIEQLNTDIKRNLDYETLSKRSEHLAKLLEGFAPLLRKNIKKNFSAKDLIESALDFSAHRFKYHKIIASCPVMTGEAKNFEISGPSNLLLATLNNIIDNAIHWTGLEAEKGKIINYKRAIQLTTLVDFFKEGPAIVLLDNGPGFNLAPDEAIQPFITTRPGGMGVGLYYADQVMESIGGKLIITDAEGLDLPTDYKGAAVVLVFNKGVL